MAKVDAYDKTTGRKLPYKVPEAWFDLPKLGKNLRKTPIQKAAEASKASKAASTKEG